MKISNRVKRNISFTLFVVGLFCMATRSVNVLQTPASIMAWFEFAGRYVMGFLLKFAGKFIMSYHGPKGYNEAATRDQKTDSNTGNPVFESYFFLCNSLYTHVFIR